MSGYCLSAPGHPVHASYHDTEYGFPLEDESGLFERLALEIFQAGLSWEITLKKRAATHRAFGGFAVDTVAAYKARDVKRLLADPGIIRNRLKVESIIDNAQRVQALRDSHGGFAGWIAAHHPRPKSEWVKIFKQTFRFTGGEIVNEFLMSVGYLPGAHREDCPVYKRIARLKPAWSRVDPKVFREKKAK